MSFYTEIESCRVSKEKDLVSILDLGNQKLTGVFPTPQEEPALERGPLELVWSPSSHLVQIKHTFEPTMMYGDNYGYRSGLNGSMIQHLTSKANYLFEFATEHKT